MKRLDFLCIRSVTALIALVDLFESRARRGQRSFNVGFAVCGRDKTRFKSRRRQINSLFQHAMEEALEVLRVTGHDLGEIGDLARVRKEQAEHAADLVDSK